MSFSVNIPRLETERLVLRAPQNADFAWWLDYYTSERSVDEGGPFDAQTAWRIWASDAASWLLNGYGAFGLEDRNSGEYLGEVGIYARPEFPEQELGWFVVPPAEGRGYAAEAARRVMVWIKETYDWDRIISIIDPGNARSIALAKRLGGVVLEDALGVDPGDVVIAHDLRGAAHV